LYIFVYLYYVDKGDNQVSVLMLFSMFEELCITNKQVFSKCSGRETVLFCTIQLGICNAVWLYIWLR